MSHINNIKFSNSHIKKSKKQLELILIIFYSQIYSRINVWVYNDVKMIHDILHSLICIKSLKSCVWLTLTVYFNGSITMDGCGCHTGLHGSIGLWCCWGWLLRTPPAPHMQLPWRQSAAHGRARAHTHTHTHTHTVTICEQSLAQKFQTDSSEIFSEFELIANFKISGYFIKKPEFMTSKKIIKSSKPRPTVPFDNSLLALLKGCPL